MYAMKVGSIWEWKASVKSFSESGSSKALKNSVISSFIPLREEYKKRDVSWVRGR
jgi:type IV secretory pathway component VirB8